MSSFEEFKHLQIPLQELSDATNGFSELNLIGMGGFGNIYKGISLKHGSIAVKKLNEKLGQGTPEFLTEISLLSVCEHKNIVSLVGFCDEDKQKMLVFNYECNGSLDKYLNNTDLNWIQRLKICLDVAHGLEYLHNDVGFQRRIIHRDIKSSNVLLNENWEAKITDFGLSKIVPADTIIILNPCGTIGYIDPDYMATGYVSEESDIYSFGVVLFEVLCGRLSYLSKSKGKRQLLTNLVDTHWRKKTLVKIIHPGLRKQIKPASLLVFSTIAYQCLQSKSKRPTVKKLVQQLQKALDIQLEQGGSLADIDNFAAHVDEQSSAGILQVSSSRSSSSGSSHASFSHSWKLSASCFQSCPTSFSQSWKYDVFLSFRGDDTRKTFVDHLYSTLEDRRIFTYKDDIVLPRGEPIRPSLFKAIEESRIAIIVFSPNYASSSCCLDELTHIMKKKDETGQIVVPIFYGIKPSELRKQKRFYGKALALHELNNNKSKVESWREALERAGDLSGWDPQTVANGHESRFIKKVCDDVSHKLFSSISLTRFEASADLSGNLSLIGIEIRMLELKSLLKVGSSGVYMVGICGMWGSGKSTLASSIYDEISHEFEGCCFIKNVRDESRMHGLKTLQEKILSNVLKVKVKLSSIEQGVYMMERRLCQKSVLIILDDVDHFDQLKMLAGSKNWFGDGSRIIFTTRNQDLVHASSSLAHNVRMLDVKEAIELFSRHAFGKSKHARGLEEVSLIMASRCGGHPSTLISLGSYLHGKDMSEWLSILNKLLGRSVDEILKLFEAPDDGIVRNHSIRFLLPN